MAQPARILAVDDERSVTELLRLILETAGYEVITTERSDEAARWLAEPDRPFDLLVTDIRMGPIDGMELLRLAKRARPSLPVIMVTAYASEEAREEARRLGAGAYLGKPFSVAELLATIARELKRAAATPVPPAESPGA